MSEAINIGGKYYLATIGKYSCAIYTHLIQVCGLKLHDCPECRDHGVTPYTGVWIETL